MDANTLKEELTMNFVSGGDAAKILNVSRWRIKALCDEGRFFGAFKYGDIWIIPKKAINDYKPKPGGRPRNKNADFIKRLTEENTIVIGTRPDARPPLTEASTNCKNIHTSENTASGAANGEGDSA